VFDIFDEESRFRARTAVDENGRKTPI